MKITGENIIHWFFSFIKFLVIGFLYLFWCTIFGIIISVIIVFIDFMI